MNVIRQRRSVRKYDSKPIPPDVMERLKDALRLAPSACNYQPWKFVFVTGPALRKSLAEACHGQAFIAEAPVVVVGVGLPGHAYKHMGGHGNSVDVDLAIALDHLTLAAVAEGVGSCWIGAFNEEQVRKIIGAPREVKVVALTPLGYPIRPDAIRPVRPGDRKPVEQVFADERFS
jgi:nitroreductase